MVHCARLRHALEDADLSPWDGQAGRRASRDTLAAHFQVEAGSLLASLRKMGMRWNWTLHSCGQRAPTARQGTEDNHGSALPRGCRAHDVRSGRGLRDFRRNPSSPGPWTLPFRPRCCSLGTRRPGSSVGLPVDHSWGGHCPVLASHTLSTSVPWLETSLPSAPQRWWKGRSHSACVGILGIKGYCFEVLNVENIDDNQNPHPLLLESSTQGQQLKKTYNLKKFWLEKCVKRLVHKQLIFLSSTFGKVSHTWEPTKLWGDHN